jgi:hypothetical protein
MTQQTAFFTFTPTVAERDEAGLPRQLRGRGLLGGRDSSATAAHGDAAVDLASTMELPQRA